MGHSDPDRLHLGGSPSAAQSSLRVWMHAGAFSISGCVKAFVREKRANLRRVNQWMINDETSCAEWSVLSEVYRASSDEQELGRKQGDLCYLVLYCL